VKPGRDAVITGIGIVSSLGEGAEVHVAALAGAHPKLDTESFAPHQVHPAAPVNYDVHIPKKADLRQMEPWQKLGTYAAGAALEQAGLKGDRERLAEMHLVVACGGGERDYAVDGAILTGLRTAANPGVYLNERLMNDIRPTLFLAQLSNLLAGNISIVHGVIGGSRTFMGEEQAGVDALRIAEARIRSGESDLYLVASATNAERADLLLIYEMAGLLWNQPFRPIFARDGQGGFIPGSAAVALVLEAREHAERRGAQALAMLHPVAADRSRRKPGDVQTGLRRMASGFSPLNAARTAVFSGATGLAAATAEERSALGVLLPNAHVVATGDMIGHSIEAQFPFGVALAAAAIAKGELMEDSVLVTSVGHHRGEGLAVVSRS
jgi:3-oxoacyl-[acyl-carrier-protein] synthase II